MGDTIRDLRGGYTLIENDIIDDYEAFTMHEVLAYMVLCRYASNDTNRCFPSYNTICKRMRVSRPTAIKAINGLIDKGVVLVEKNKKDDGNNESNIYTIVGYKKENKKSPTSAKVKDEKNSNYNNSICNKDNNNTSSAKNKVENVANKLTEVEKAIKESNVNIRKEDLKECNETFTNIDVLVKALGLVESDRGHGIKALRGAYKKVMGLVTPSNKGYLNNNSMTIDGKKLSDYTEEEFNKMVEEKQKVFKPTFTNTPKVEGESFK